MLNLKNGSIQKNFIYSLQAKGNLSGYQQDTQKYMIEFDSFDADITQKTITIELMKKAQVDIKPDDQKMNQIRIFLKTLFIQVIVHK